MQIVFLHLLSFCFSFSMRLSLSLSPSLYFCSPSSCTPPIPPLSTPLALPVLLLCLSGYDDWGFSCSHLIECLCERVVGVVVVVWLRECVCVCLPLRCAVSLSLPPGSEEPPSSRSVIGQKSGVLDTAWCWLLRDVFQQMVEVRECHHIGERIRGERLSSRSCVVPPTLETKIAAPRHKPLYERREIRWSNVRIRLREES